MIARTYHINDKVELYVDTEGQADLLVNGELVATSTNGELQDLAALVNDL